MKKLILGGLPTNLITRVELSRIMSIDCSVYRTEGLPAKLVFSSNGQGIALANQNRAFLDCMKKADIIHADGQSVVFASKLLCTRQLPERVATTDFFHDAAKEAQAKGLTFFMLGAEEEENILAVRKIKNMYPKLKIVGNRSGYFKEHSQEEDDLIEEINKLKPDVLWVALGKPKQEFWCARVKDRLNVGWIKTCGGLYEFLSGNVSRAPNWMQRVGLEWLYRLSKDPQRLFLRYLVTNFFAIKYLMTRTKKDVI